MRVCVYLFYTTGGSKIDLISIRKVCKLHFIDYSRFEKEVQYTVHTISYYWLISLTLSIYHHVGIFKRT